MAERLTDRLLKALPVPARGNKIYFDGEVGGFAARVTAAGARSFVLDYRSGGCRRRITIGNFPDWTTSAARDEAKALKRRIDRGEDPMAARHEERAAPTIDDLCERYVADEMPKKRPLSRRDFSAIINTIIRPKLGKRKIADVKFADVERLHRDVSSHAPVRANRVVSLLRTLFNLAIKWGYRPDNPCKGVQWNPEDRRERFLSQAEMAALAAALAEHRDQRSADAIRLLMLTGARRGEALSATWDQFDLATSTWTKPSAATKQKRLHRVPLGAPAVELLTSIREQQREAEEKARRAGQPVTPCPYVFPGDRPGTHVTDVKKSWATLTARATVLQWAHRPETPEGQLVARLRQEQDRLPTFAECRRLAAAEKRELPPGLTDARLHDLRHSFASILLAGGESLTLIGAMLGHTQVATTARYAHLADDPLRAAAERVGQVYAAAQAARPAAEVVKLPRAR